MSLPEAPGPTQQGDALQFVRVSSGYEAAAELLSAPASALVVDLGRITPPHMPLLDLAAKLDVPVVAFGTVSSQFTSEQLSLLRLASAEGITETLREILGLGLPAPAAAAATSTEPAAEPAKPPAASLEARRPRRGVEEALTQAELDALLREEP